MASFLLDIVTPDKMLFKGPVQSVRVPGTEGSLGVMAGHAPMMTALCCGPIKLVHENGDVEFIATGGGFLEVRRDGVTVLADTAERQADIDISRVETAINRARADLESGSAADYEAAQEALQRALNRAKVAQMHE